MDNLRVLFADVGGKINEAWLEECGLLKRLPAWREQCFEISREKEKV